MRFKLLVTSLTALALAACGAIGGQTPTPLPTVVLGGATPQASALAPSGAGVTASGHIAFATAGNVISLTVSAGDTVQAGQVLATLSGGDRLAAAIEVANLDLLNAQHAIKDLQDSAAMAAAQAQLDIVQGQLNIAQAQLNIAQAQSALTKANKDLRNVQNPAGQSLQDAVDKAKLALNTAQNNALLSTVSADAQALVQATAQTNILFSKYQDQQAKWDAGDHSDTRHTALLNAQSAYQSALDTKTQLELRIQTDKANGDQTVKDAQKAYNDAVNNQAGAQRGPDADKLAVAQGNVAVAQSSVVVAQGSVAVAQAALAQAQTRYAALKPGPDPERLAEAQQRLATAQAQLAAAKSALGDLDLKASISGTITDLRIHAGEWVTPGQPVVVISDLAHLQVETADLSERDVPRVAVGQAVTVLVKALNQSVPGQVTRIAPLADTLGGDIVYKTTIELTNFPAGLRSGMSVDVQFGTSP
jgi:multidrug efflux pump subunit AcrA (membrane-fusion protein)